MDGRQELDQKILKLSMCINRETDLYCLATIGLGLPMNVVDKHIKNNRDEFTMAVYGVLQQWSNSIENHKDAHEKLCEALGKEGVDMKKHRKALKRS